MFDLGRVSLVATRGGLFRAAIEAARFSVTESPQSELVLPRCVSPILWQDSAHTGSHVPFAAVTASAAAPGPCSPLAAAEWGGDTTVTGDACPLSMPLPAWGHWGSESPLT